MCEQRIDDIFIIADDIDNMALQDKLSERLTQLDAATQPPDTDDAEMGGEYLHGYLWMLQALIRQASGIVSELHNRVGD